MFGRGRHPTPPPVDTRSRAEIRRDEELDRQERDFYMGGPKAWSEVFSDEDFNATGGNFTFGFRVDLANGVRRAKKYKVWHAMHLTLIIPEFYPAAAIAEMLRLGLVTGTNMGLALTKRGKIFCLMLHEVVYPFYE
ncbi:MAG TPA: hypothetical protein VMT30_05005 [Candidatus Saccharimonadia bacterium]|nr:hypothetical protein [Candidatus Saccharimonadia bacterium]